MLLFGTVVYDAAGKHGAWQITCEPQVKIRLKRAFPRMDQAAAITVSIKATAENTRDLEWFLERYPMAMSDVDAALMAQRAGNHKLQEERISKILDGSVVPSTVNLAEPAREYQILAADMLATRGGQLLADKVGTGKTVTAICSLVRSENLPAVVVTPAHLPSHWVRFLKRFAPDLNVHRVKKGTPYALRKTGSEASLFPELGQPDVLVVSYHKLRGWAESLAGNIKLVVFEECQQLRRSDSDIYRACKLLAEGATRRLGLSATPIYGYGSEFYHILDCLFPDAFGDMEEFNREWCSGYYGHKKIADPAAFGVYLRREGLMLRRSRKDIGRELPHEPQKIVEEVDCDPAVIGKIGGNAMALAKIIVGENEKYRGEKLQASGELDALVRQATGVAKAPYVAEFVRMLLESGEKVVLFGWHRNVYDIWLEKLADFKPAMYTGTESATQKDAAVARFCKGETDLLIMSLRSGAGVDGLQHFCNTVVFGELDWSPGVHEQCLGRVDREGQEEPVVAYFLTTDMGADPIMIEVLGVKKAQSDGVIEPEADAIRSLEKQGDHIKEVARRLLAGKVMVPSENGD